MRLETPEYLQVKIDKSSLEADVPLTHIVWERNWPDESKRKPGVIYLPDMACGERDETLGRFLAAWNRVERQIQFLISTYLKTDISMASAIFDLGLGVSQTHNLLINAASNTLKTGDLKRLGNWLDRYKRFNTKRNRIVHGDWVCSLVLGVDENGIVKIIDQRWVRKYDPPDKETRDRMQKEDRDAVIKYQFSVDGILDLCDQAQRLEVDAYNLPNRQDGAS